MIVYTVQHINVLEKLQTEGEYRTNPNFICDDNFVEAYNWINEQAKQKIKGWQGERPLWLWLEKPDLRSYRFILDPEKPKSQDFVLLTLDIPLDNMLISEFGLWHSVLNKRYVAYNNKEDDELEKIFDPHLRSVENMPKHLQERLFKTWERCLCDEKGKLQGFDSKYIEPTSFQAIVEQVSIHQLKNVKHFKMINKKR